MQPLAPGLPRPLNGNCPRPPARNAAFALRIAGIGLQARLARSTAGSGTLGAQVTDKTAGTSLQARPGRHVQVDSGVPQAGAQPPIEIVGLGNVTDNQHSAASLGR